MKIIQTLLFLTILAIFSVSVFGQKMSADEILAKHLDSIGTKEKRAAIKNQIVVSNVQVAVTGTTANITGNGVMASAGKKNLWGINLSSNDYPQERFGFNGKEARIAYSKPGVRSTIGGFIYANPELLKSGLLGGTLFSSWALLGSDPKQFKLSYDGTKKIDGKEAYALGFTPRGGSDLSITMYFDKENFRHLRTEYSRIIAARQGATVDSSAGQSPDRYRLTEDFSDFQTVNGVTIPGTYHISYSYSGSSSLTLANAAYREIEWKFKVTNFSVNQDIDDSSFEIQVK